MCIEAKVPKKLVPCDNTWKTKMRESGNGTCRKFVMSMIAFAFLIATLVVPADSFSHGNFEAPTKSVLLQRLCSKSLSDALYLICQDHGGYNEPFSYSHEEAQRPYSSGPGLVEECCYRPCSFQQLEQYCKPLKTEEDDDYSNQEGMEESVRIVNLPYDSSEQVATEKSRHAVTRDEHDVERKKKSKPRSVTAGRNNKRNGQKHAGPSSKTASNLTKKIYKAKRLRGHKDVRYANWNNNDADSPIDRRVETRSKNIPHHHERAKRPLRFKLQPARDTAIAKVPGFKVATTLPDPKDSTINIFPSRRNLVIEH